MAKTKQDGDKEKILKSARGKKTHHIETKIRMGALFSSGTMQVGRWKSNIFKVEKKKSCQAIIPCYH